MLASPLLPASHNFGSHGSQHAQEGPQPAKDLPTFKKMLEPAVEFVEGSSSGAYVGLEGKYQPINVAAPLPPKTPAKPEKNADPKPTPTATPAPVPPTPKAQGKTLWPATIDTTWPSSCNVGSGLHNLGNTCFLNSALQCLLHTPPLLHILNGHTKDTCRNDKFCMTCSLRDVARQAHSGKRAFAPTSITNRLQTIAKHMRKGRQEDTHEFLRYAIDALQKACLFGHPPKIDPKLAETTWVHKMFGGRLRSRVTCRECEHNSDTFDRILDLSLDIFKVETVKDALKKFVAIDYLKGADKYKCEKCKKPVVAEKRFTIHEAPVVLTVHLKRFSPLGRKIAHHIDYDEKLSLAPYMSDGQYGPSYSLYGVICHAGSGPNSGHYYAFVKSRDGKWYEMNDDSVTPSPPPLNKKSAYMLFYIRDKGQGLEAAVKSKSVGGREQSSQRPARITDGMKGQKRKEREGDAEDVGVKVENPVLGPLLASPTINGDSKKLRADDPQARAIKAKIEAAAAKKKASSTLSGLTQYNSDDNDSNSDDGKDDEKEPGEIDSSPSKDANMDSSPPKPPRTSSPNGDGPNGIAPSSFYGSNRPPKKRKSSDQWQDRGEKKRPFGTPKGKVQYGNPYSGLTTYSSKNKRRRAPRGI